MFILVYVFMHFNLTSIQILPCKYYQEYVSKIVMINVLILIWNLFFSTFTSSYTWCSKIKETTNDNDERDRESGARNQRRSYRFRARDKVSNIGPLNYF
jgi:hypothetical protein